MVYLRCENCGHYNEVRTEYVTFCEKCNEKLEPNFAGWKRQNRVKTFDDFQKEVCIPHEQMIREQITPKKKKEIPRGLIIVSIIVLFFVGLGTVAYFAMPYAKTFVKQAMENNPEVVYSTLNRKDWERQALGMLGLSIETPVPLVAMDANNMFAPEVKAVIQQAEVFNTNVDLLKFTINAASIKYVDGAFSSIENAKDGALANMKNQPGISEFSNTDSEYSLNDASGYLSEGTFLVNNSKAGYKMLVLHRNNTLCQVIVLCHTWGEQGEAFADKVINSVRVE